MVSSGRRGPIGLAYLNGFAPPWADGLLRGIAASVPDAVEEFHVALDLTYAYLRERGQYHATLVLARLLRYQPTDVTTVVGITDVDLCVPVLTFVFGQAQLDGRGAIVSTHRLRNEYYGLPPDPEALVRRTVAEAVHELGHVYGLVHCPDYRCVMHASTSVDEVDVRGARFCTSCRTRMAPAGP